MQSGAEALQQVRCIARTARRQPTDTGVKGGRQTVGIGRDPSLANHTKHGDGTARNGGGPSNMEADFTLAHSHIDQHSARDTA